MLEAAQAYAEFARGRNPNGQPEAGIENTRLLGGRSIKQHFILLMAARGLTPARFTRLADEIEKTMFVWLITGTPGKEYERRIIDAAHKLRDVSESGFEAFLEAHLVRERRDLAKDFERALLDLGARDVRAFRLRYLLAKLTQYVDLQAYGPSESRSRLGDYVSGGNDIEHILADRAGAEALQEFGSRGDDQDLIQSLGNLLLIEKSINRSISNGSYSAKVEAYRQSKFLLTKCQADAASAEIGTGDRITLTVKRLKSWPAWEAEAVAERQAFLTELAQEV